jgi:hypothetical protein
MNYLGALVLGTLVVLALITVVVMFFDYMKSK